MDKLNAAEEVAVETLGDRIGYGRLMQLAEQIWHRKAVENGTPGGEHTRGPCAAFMVRCLHLDDDVHLSSDGHCDWCCGSGRVTKRVADAMNFVAYGTTSA